jgi:hypothetical protein
MTGRLSHAIMVNSNPSFCYVTLARCGNHNLALSQFLGQEAGAHRLPLLS